MPRGLLGSSTGAPPPPRGGGGGGGGGGDAPVNFKDVLTEALGKLRNVDHLIKLFTDVAPHSRHVAELRGVSDELGMYGGVWGTSAVDPNSIVGLFLRRCCLDFERLTFEGTAGGRQFTPHN